MAETDPHSGRDQELVERFVLGRLSSRERAAFDAHLAGCVECRALVDQELRIAAGVRRAGREEFAARLHRRLNQAGQGKAGRESSRLPWPRIVAVAASLLILAGIGIVQFWLSPEGKETRFSEISQPTTAPTATLEKGVEGGSGETAGKELPAPYAAKSAPMKSTADNRANEMESPPAKGVRPQLDEELRDFSPREKDRSEMGVLVEGKIVEPAVADRLSGMKKERAELDQAVSAAAAPAVREAVRQDAATNAWRNTVRNAQLSQGAGNTGLESGQLRQEGRRNLLTRMQNVNNQLQLTLYPETLFAEEALRRARIEPIGDDSLRVTIGNQTILYKIPQQIQQQAPSR